MRPYMPGSSFPRFTELPENVQTAVWKHALPSLAPHIFRWAPYPSFLAEEYGDRGHTVYCTTESGPVGLFTRSGRYLYPVQFLPWDFDPLKEFFNIISTCCAVRKMGLQRWRDCVERMDPVAGWYEESGNPYFVYDGWEGDDSGSHFSDGGG